MTEHEIAALQAQVKDLRDALTKARHQHNYCEDRWYTCPKHPDARLDNGDEDDCNCGADEANAIIDAALSDPLVREVCDE